VSAPRHGRSAPLASCRDCAAARMIRYPPAANRSHRRGGMDRNRMLNVMSLLLMIVVGACALNFIVYLAGTIVLGGEALNHGSVSNGHFTRATAAQKRLLWVSSSTAAGRRQRSRLRSLSLSQPSSALSSSGSMPTSPRVCVDRSSHNPPEFFAVSNASATSSHLVPWLNGNITCARVRTSPRFNVTFCAPACHSPRGCLALFRLRAVCSRWGKVSPGAQPRCAGTDPTIAQDI